MFFRSLIISLVLFALPATGGAAQNLERVALVIGASNYQQVPPLTNPKNDATDIGKMLEDIGFTVSLVSDPGHLALQRAFRSFKRQALNADVAIIYYAGHGIEVEGQNYLIPTDADLSIDSDVLFETVPLTSALESVTGARRLSLVIVDACRDNPFANKIVRSVETRSIGRGLAYIEPTGNTLVAYAAREGTVALDGDARNSPYAEALLESLPKPGIEIGLMFRRIRDRVVQMTDGQQEPFLYGSLSAEPFYFVAPETKQPEPKQEVVASIEPPVNLSPTRDVLPAQSRAEQEMLFWQSIKDSDQPAYFEAYLDQFPEGMYAAIARIKIAALEVVSQAQDFEQTFEQSFEQGAVEQTEIEPAPVVEVPPETIVLGGDPPLESDEKIREVETIPEKDTTIVQRDFITPLTGTDARIDAAPKVVGVLETTITKDVTGKPRADAALASSSVISKVAALREEEQPAELSSTRETDLDGEALALLTDPTAPAPQALERATPEPDPVIAAEEVERSLGLRRSNWREVQESLKALGHNPRGIDGLPGPATRRALRQWQARAGVPETGYLTRETRRELIRRAAPRVAALRAQAQAEAERAEASTAQDDAPENSGLEDGRQAALNPAGTVDQTDDTDPMPGMWVGRASSNDKSSHHQFRLKLDGTGAAFGGSFSARSSPLASAGDAASSASAAIGSSGRVQGTMGNGKSVRIRITPQGAGPTVFLTGRLVNGNRVNGTWIAGARTGTFFMTRL